MRIFATHPSKEEVDQEIEALLGPRGLRGPWTSDRVGPARMEVKDFSSGFFELLLGQNGPLRASLHKRPKGILVELRGPELQGSWAVPYHELSVFKAEFLSIHGAGQFLKLTSDADVHGAVRTLLEDKAAFLGDPRSGLGSAGGL